jgi:hypothetical protein
MVEPIPRSRHHRLEQAMRQDHLAGESPDHERGEMVHCFSPIRVTRSFGSSVTLLSWTYFSQHS